MSNPIKDVGIPSQKEEISTWPYMNNVEYDLRLRQLMEELVLRSNIETNDERINHQNSQSSNSPKADADYKNNQQNLISLIQNTSISKKNSLIENSISTTNLSENTSTSTAAQKIQLQLDFLQKNAEKFKKFQQVQERPKNIASQVKDIDLKKVLIGNLNKTKFNQSNIEYIRKNNIENTTQFLQWSNKNISEEYYIPNHNYTPPISLAEYLKNINLKRGDKFFKKQNELLSQLKSTKDSTELEQTTVYLQDQNLKSEKLNMNAETIFKESKPQLTTMIQKLKTVENPESALLETSTNYYDFYSTRITEHSDNKIKPPNETNNFMTESVFNKFNISYLAGNEEESPNYSKDNITTVDAYTETNINLTKSKINISTESKVSDNSTKRYETTRMKLNSNGTEYFKFTTLNESSTVNVNSNNTESFGSTTMYVNSNDEEYYKSTTKNIKSNDNEYYESTTMNVNFIGNDKYELSKANMNFNYTEFYESPVMYINYSDIEPLNINYRNDEYFQSTNLNMNTNDTEYYESTTTNIDFTILGINSNNTKFTTMNVNSSDTEYYESTIMNLKFSNNEYDDFNTINVNSKDNEYIETSTMMVNTTTLNSNDVGYIEMPKVSGNFNETYYSESFMGVNSNKNYTKYYEYSAMNVNFKDSDNEDFESSSIVVNSNDTDPDESQSSNANSRFTTEEILKYHNNNVSKVSSKKPFRNQTTYNYTDVDFMEESDEKNSRKTTVFPKQMDEESIEASTIGPVIELCHNSILHEKNIGIESFKIGTSGNSITNTLSSGNDSDKQEKITVTNLTSGAIAKYNYEDLDITTTSINPFSDKVSSATTNVNLEVTSTTVSTLKQNDVADIDNKNDSEQNYTTIDQINESDNNFLLRKNTSKNIFENESIRNSCDIKYNSEKNAEITNKVRMKTTSKYDPNSSSSSKLSNVDNNNKKDQSNLNILFESMFNIEHNSTAGNLNIGKAEKKNRNQLSNSLSSSNTSITENAKNPTLVKGYTEESNTSVSNELNQNEKNGIVTEVVWLTQSSSYQKPSIVIEKVPYKTSIPSPLYSFTTNLSNLGKLKILKPEEKPNNISELISIIGSSLQGSPSTYEELDKKQHEKQNVNKNKEQTLHKIKEDVTSTVNCHTTSMSISIPTLQSPSEPTLTMTMIAYNEEEGEEGDTDAEADKTIKNDKQNSEKRSTFKNKQQNIDSSTKSGNYANNKNTNTDKFYDTDVTGVNVYVNGTRDYDGDDGSVKDTKTLSNKKNIRLKKKVDSNGNIYKNNGNPTAQANRKNHSMSNIPFQKKYIKANEFKESQRNTGINKMSTIENKLIDISKHKSDFMTKATTVPYDTHGIFNKTNSKKDYQNNGNEIIKKSSKVVYEGNSNDDEGNVSLEEADHLQGTNSETKNMFHNLLKMQPFPATTLYYSNSNHTNSNNNKFGTFQIEKEITTTNWWHFLPYAEIKKFLNSIFDGATSNDDLSLNGSLDLKNNHEETTAKTTPTQDNNEIKTIKVRKSKYQQWSSWILNNIWSSIL
ncbi:uncharacterized protein ACRADG_010934 [Cochliomyia hominivorax]